MSIHDSVEKIKSWIKGDEWQDIVIVIIVLFVGIGSFFLGRWSKIYPQTKGDSPLLEITEPLSEAVQKTLPTETFMGDFVASKNGTKYYPLGCSGIERIKEENRIYFESEDKAIVSGRTKSSTCK